ncbi:SRPBCC family protein [Methylococcus sp. EFPC2]|uniref:SRPBCC family protein n=1 Tax=Methylococcus sp. EFPC2 TaxID=2812648 RepID=UPI001967738C|nr:SRPBCC family protein [Methylococcus sp. EFPC2]QSA97897.1 SRPBCC family protein [Methylococcus sp. EFPC2]
MFKLIAAAFVIALLALLIYAATKADTFRVQRSTRIKAVPDRIFPLINDLHAWLEWSPYEKKDSAMKRSFSGTTSGKGAVYAWDGNKDVGAGSMEIQESFPPSLLVFQLDFIRPFEARNTVEFTLEPEGEATAVTWAMHGPMPYISKLMSVFFSMDKMIGKDFETGLANLKAIAEK